MTFRRRRKQTILLSVARSSTYHLIRSVVAPETPPSHSYTKLVDLLTKHHNPTPPITAQRYRFHSHTRRIGESVNEYVAALRTISKHCDFKDTINDMLRDRLVCGIGDKHIQRKLLADSTMRFENVMDTALFMQAADKHS